MTPIGTAAAESQATIHVWAEETFGPSTSVIRLLGRANTEMAELIRAATSDEAPERIGEEAADAAIVLCRVGKMLGVCVPFDLRVPTGLTRDGPLRLVLAANQAVAKLMADVAKPAGPSPAMAGAFLMRAFLYLAATCETVGSTLTAEIDRKMAINRQRRWVGGGGQDEHHIRVREAA